MKLLTNRQWEDVGRALPTIHDLRDGLFHIVTRVSRTPLADKPTSGTPF